MYPKQPSYPTQVETVESVIRSELLQAIDQNNPRICEEIIQRDPQRVHEVGWNDLTPLHQVCLRGNMGILQILLHHGANIEAKSAFGETPLHYACRRGDVRIMHTLIEAGSDVNVVDKQGRTCIHFAANGGNVPAVHYLGTQTQLHYDAKDINGDTVLHIACVHRHFHLVQYLLRNSRCDPRIQNNKGITALHIVAQMGNTEVLWQLLMVGKCGLVHVKDVEGQSPIDTARKELTNRHKQVTEALRYYAQQDPLESPAGPKFTWYFLLALPFVWAGLVFFLSSYFNSHAGHFAVIMFVILVGFVTRQSHRIHHASRWPNPIYLGAFSAGILHCILAAYIKILYDQWPHYLTFLAVTALSSSSLYYLRLLSTGDPGILKHSQTSSDGRPLTILDVANGRCKEQDFCIFTELIKPDRTKYCRLCQHVMLDLDHHCLFLTNCVARYNHRSFVIFILNVMVLQVFFVAETYSYVTQFYPNSIMESYVSIMFHYEPWLFDLSLLCVLAFTWGCTLIFVQMRSIMRGETVYFSMHRPHKLSWKEAFMNVMKFFMKPSSTGKERLLNKSSTLLL